MNTDTLFSKFHEDFYQRIWRMCYGYMRRFGYAYSEQENMADDAASTVWLKIWRRQEKEPVFITILRDLPDGEREAYLRVCCRNATLDVLKRKRRGSVQHVSLDEIQHEIVTPDKDHQQEIDELMERVDRLISDVKRFTPEEQELWRLRKLGLTYKEMAEQLNTNKDTVRKRTDRLTVKVKKFLM